MHFEEKQERTNVMVMTCVAVLAIVPVKVAPPSDSIIVRT